MFSANFPKMRPFPAACSASEECFRLFGLSSRVDKRQGKQISSESPAMPSKQFPNMGNLRNGDFRVVILTQQVQRRFGAISESTLATMAFSGIDLWMNGSNAFEMMTFRVTILKYLSCTVAGCFATSG
jgi:hypothetical protein